MALLCLLLDAVSRLGQTPNVAVVIVCDDLNTTRFNIELSPHQLRLRLMNWAGAGMTVPPGVLPYPVPGPSRAPLLQMGCTRQSTGILDNKSGNSQGSTGHGYPMAAGLQAKAVYWTGAVAKCSTTKKGRPRRKCLGPSCVSKNGWKCQWSHRSARI